MQRHTVIGAKILGGSNARILRTAAEIAEHHHERWDGKGIRTDGQGRTSLSPEGSLP